jgi:hypothetical protein
MSFSVIIPTLNEEGYVGCSIRSARANGATEVIVVDGGSTDRTLEEAAGADVVVRATRGRGCQLNEGTRHARGEHLLFLHADCALEPGAAAEAADLLGRQRVVAVCFQQHVCARGPIYRGIDWFASLRVRLTGVPYGDQGLFIRRATFAALGGFPEVGCMEDLLFGRRLRHAGRVAVARRRIFVSPRRWQRVGLVVQTIRNWSLTALALGGVPPERLSRFYPALR